MWFPHPNCNTEFYRRDYGFSLTVWYDFLRKQWQWSALTPAGHCKRGTADSRMIAQMTANNAVGL